MSTEIATRAAISIPPALAKAGVQVVEQNGVRAVMIPPNLREHYNIVQPVGEITQADPDWSPRLVVVDLSDPQYSYTEQGKQALTRNGVLLLAHAAGIEVDVNPMPRDQLRDNEIGYKATATVRRSDGTLARWSESKIANLDDEEQATKATNEKWPVVKKHLPARTETKACLRAISMALQLKRGGYTKQDLLRPFLIVGTSLTPSDPETRRLRVLQAGDALAGRGLPAPSVESAVPGVSDEHRIAQGSTTPVAPEAAQTGAPTPDVVDTVPSSARNAEPDPEHAAGEMPPDVEAAGAVVFPVGFRAVGKTVSGVRREYVNAVAFEMTIAPEHEHVAKACSVWAAWLDSQEVQP